MGGCVCKPERAPPLSHERSECKPDRAQPSSHERSECKPDRAQPSRKSMKSVLLALLLQSLLMPPRVSLENPAAMSPIPQKLKKDYDKAWSRFLTTKEDAKL